MANVAKEFNYVQPTLTYENVIIIDKGRHPIQELCVSSFVPNSTFSGDKYGKMKLITGPNASGKSVYLKQVGLIIFMAHIGSYVPAQSASIGLVDAIYSRIHTMESISVGLSTFMIDLNQMALATKCATERSLVLVDEFGKGTSAVDGMALLAACVNYWLAKEEQCPHTLVSTHIYGATTWLLRSEQLKFQMLDVAEEGDELVYLYQLKDGEAACSYATHVARQAGVREDIIKRAVEITQAVRQSQPIPSRGDQEHEVFERCSAIVEEFENVDLESSDEVQSFLDRLRLQWMKADCKERASKKPQVDDDTESIATKTTVSDYSE